MPSSPADATSEARSSGQYGSAKDTCVVTGPSKNVYARDFVKEHYVLSRPIPRYSAIAERLARVGRRLEAARLLVHRATYMADAVRSMGAPRDVEAAMLDYFDQAATAMINTGLSQFTSP